MVYPDVYYKSERRGVDFKSDFQIDHKEHKEKKSRKHLGKDPSVYKNREETFNFEQKPLNIADFIEEEEKNCLKY